jgi:hypothetical protein
MSDTTTISPSLSPPNSPNHLSLHQTLHYWPQSAGIEGATFHSDSGDRVRGDGDDGRSEVEASVVLHNDSSILLYIMCTYMYIRVHVQYMYVWCSIVHGRQKWFPSLLWLFLCHYLTYPSTLLPSTVLSLLTVFGCCPHVTITCNVHTHRHWMCGGEKGPATKIPWCVLA